LSQFYLIFAAVVVAVAAVAALVALVALVLVAPTTVALAGFIVTLTVIATAFLAVDIGCYLPLPPEEDHRLPPPSGKVPSWPSSSSSS
jgi:hypothetical protein